MRDELARKQREFLGLDDVVEERHLVTRLYVVLSHVAEVGEGHHGGQARVLFD